jgi:hypothetical protein
VTRVRRAGGVLAEGRALATLEALVG